MANPITEIRPLFFDVSFETGRIDDPVPSSRDDRWLITATVNIIRADNTSEIKRKVYILDQQSEIQGMNATKQRIINLVRQEEE
jgi:hypothetical protein